LRGRRTNIDGLLAAWIETAREQSKGGNTFGYAWKKSPHRLLHMPLEPVVDNLNAQHRRFLAGRSMRDVEPDVAMIVKDPWGNPIVSADDLA
jgi:hypothetical protein